jgi:hypothetical protein
MKVVLLVIVEVLVLAIFGYAQQPKVGPIPNLRNECLGKLATTVNSAANVRDRWYRRCIISVWSRVLTLRENSHIIYLTSHNGSYRKQNRFKNYRKPSNDRSRNAVL